MGEAVTDDDSVTVKATRFTIINLDDGVNEVVLWLQINGVMDYGYTLPYRSFMSVKTKGTFTFSDCVADSEIGKLRFSADGYDIENVIGKANSEDGIYINLG